MNATDKMKNNDNPAESEDSWMVRPCEAYYDELKECKSMRGRFHQYFVHGEKIDCSKWQEDLNNCTSYKMQPTQRALESLIDNEKERREKRLTGAKSNDVWEYRTSPPEDWSKPLPEHLQKKMPQVVSKSTCVVS